MSKLRVPMRTGTRDPERFPEDDDALGRSLFSLVAGRLARGLPRPVVLGVRTDTVQQIDGKDLHALGRREHAMLLAAFAGQDEMQCLAVVGTLKVRMPGMKQAGNALAVFIEWPDNRWWGAWQFVDPSRELLGDGPVVRKAVDGWPRPSGVGGWFARARRTGAKLRVEPRAPVETPLVVH